MQNETRVEQLKSALDQLNNYNLLIGKDGSLTAYRDTEIEKPYSMVKMRVLDPEAPINRTPIELIGRTHTSVMADDENYTRIEVYPINNRTSRVDVWHRDATFPYDEMLKVGFEGVRVVQLVFMLESALGELADFARLRKAPDGTLEDRLIDRLEEVEMLDQNLATYPSRIKHALRRTPTRVVNMTW